MIPWYKSLAFWKAATLVVAVLLVQFGVVDVLDAGKLLAMVLAVLELFNITPELRAKGLIK
jgi:hypothetical protein